MTNIWSTHLPSFPPCGQKMWSTNRLSPSGPFLTPLTLFSWKKGAKNHTYIIINSCDVCQLSVISCCPNGKDGLCRTPPRLGKIRKVKVWHSFLPGVICTYYERDYYLWTMDNLTRPENHCICIKTKNVEKLSAEGFISGESGCF